jgi:hypothetical protein
MIALAVAGLMAVGSLSTGILRDTAVHTVRLFARDAPEELSATYGVLICAAYWLVFLVALLTAVYLAFIDMRYIRLQYAIEKQRLFQQSLGDDITSSARDNQRHS